MEEMIVTQGLGYSARPSRARDAATAYQTAAWRAPATLRFDGRAANDFLARAEVIAPRTYSVQPAEAEEMPRWIVVVIGALVAALMGALLGGMMSV